MLIPRSVVNLSAHSDHALAVPDSPPAVTRDEL